MINIIEDIQHASLKRSVEAGTEEQRKTVLHIMERVKAEGDGALLALTEQFDRVKLEKLRLTQEEIAQAYQDVEPSVVETFREAIHNIRTYHEHQTRNSWMTTSPTGTILGQKITPLERVGVYVPGGTAALLSSVLMTVIPAKVAGVEQIMMCTPPSSTGRVNSSVLVAADLVGISEIYSIGGAQAIAAMTYGTASIQPVDKIVGPGNIYVALAKREVFGVVDIDMVAGPSEIVVLADGQQNPRYIAADLLSQAEHDVLASAILVTTSKELALEVQEEIERQLAELPRQEIARASIDRYGAIYVTSTLEEAIDVVNQLAPEHLEVMVENPFHWLGQIKHAGAIFLGESSSEPVGDYFAGPNHVLPTNGTARFSSPLGVDDFVKKSSIIAYSRSDLERHGDKIMTMARYEGLEGHARAIQVRLEKERK